ncbi:hypothetical protein [Bradyrhizobium sp. 1(2017)]|uniref:hypothetical protein n=1 Tax=Bradyrhizobium sp. 1(2017) TaxID=1404888 RepID=UPI00140EC361|nr:hypothetical protein [Bradyrhizobium sp. 1(2017)]QIO36915.1 hypothetical protein HAP40_36470 [Bradyrhizobium sp. 1(2017)]
MAAFKLDERVQLSIELALTAKNPDLALLERQDIDAKRVGLTGAEIDAARRGWSFDVQTSIVLALAAASDEPDQEKQRERALKAGISQETCSAIEDLVRRRPGASRQKEPPNDPSTPP